LSLIYRLVISREFIQFVFSRVLHFEWSPCGTRIRRDALLDWFEFVQSQSSLLKCSEERSLLFTVASLFLTRRWHHEVNSRLQTSLGEHTTDVESSRCVHTTVQLGRNGRFGSRRLEHHTIPVMDDSSHLLGSSLHEFNSVNASSQMILLFQLPSLGFPTHSHQIRIPRISINKRSSKSKRLAGHPEID
ncbi:hypothetical protein PFISCL1PPCAC_10716, partial [Pristionchus fissidentatus]